MGVHRFVSAAARAAAAKARRKRTALKVANPNPLAVFVVRDGNSFGWEIRQFGSVTVKKGSQARATTSYAQAAGYLALVAHFADTAAQPTRHDALPSLESRPV